MRDVYIVGVGQTPVTRQFDQSLGDMGAGVVRAALDSCGNPAPTALYVGNMLGGMLSEQVQVGTVIAHKAGLGHIEALTSEAACGSGGAASHVGVMAVRSGLHDVVVVCGIEHMTHTSYEQATRALATASDWETEGSQGATFISLNAYLMQAYMETHRVDASVFAPFAINAHRNAFHNPYACFHKQIDQATYLTARSILDPLRLYDVAPLCNGSAALILAAEDIAKSLAAAGHPIVKIRASAVGTDTLALSKRTNLLKLAAVERSTLSALAQARLTHQDIDLFECHDAYTIMSVLSLEAAGFAAEGRGYTLGLDGQITVDGQLPITTMGGLKARGHPVGATGIYQLVEAFQQLVGVAGQNQVQDATIAMAQNMGGTGATVITHVLERHR